MVNVECPVLAMKERTVREVVGMIDETPANELAKRGLLPGDKYSMVSCSVGTCTVRGAAELRSSHSSTIYSYEIVDPADCQKQVPVDEAAMHFSSVYDTEKK